MVNEEKAILKYLIENKEKKFSINQLAKARKINYKSAYQNIIKLEKRKIISVERLGNINNCSFNYVFDSLVFEVEYERRSQIIQDKKINSIYRELKKLTTSFFVALIFGSYASGKQTKHSDIDLMLIRDNKKSSQNIHSKLSLLPFKIHLVDLSIEEFMSMLKSREFSVVEEVKNNNIILFGIENYYHLIKDVR